MKKIGKWLVPFILVVFVLSVPVVAMAYSTYGGSWQDTSAGIPEVTGTPLGLDITNAYHAYSGESHYFQIDLGASTNTVTGTGNIGYWTIYISTTAPANSADFDYSINYKKNGSTGVFSLNNTSLTGANLTGSAVTNNNTSYLQWRYLDSGSVQLGTNFYWWAETVAKSNKLQENTFENPAQATPIPSAAWLLGSGVIGLIGLKRRKRKTA